MLNALIRFALHNRLIVMAAAIGVLVLGGMTAQYLPIDVLPDLTRPRVVLLTEAPGFAPEEVEALITFPLEAVLNGASGVQAVRSASGIGLSVIYVEFDWNADIYTARQIVQERITGVLDELPEGVTPKMGPISSLLGQIMQIGLWSEDGSTNALDLRTMADWVVKKRLLSVAGVAQVITMGGGKRQYQVLVDPHLLHRYELELHDIERALSDGNLNVTGGYVDDDAKELLIRGIGRVQSVEDVAQIVVKPSSTRPVLVRDVARVIEGAAVKRGDSSVNGRPAVVITIQKQPGFDTRKLTEEINTALEELRRSLPDDIRLQTTYQQREFIDYSVQNVIDAVRDGAVLVVIVLFVFLLNYRTTLITLTAIPLSILTTALVFKWLGQSINVMTLGGIAVALGELVDDAIVDVENIYHRLKENAAQGHPRPVLTVIYDASSEVRGAIIMSTILVVLVFLPLFALTGMEGRLFAPLGVAYIVSICASTLVSLTVTPVLSYYLLPNDRRTLKAGDGFVLQALKGVARYVVRFSMTRGGLLLMSLVAAVAIGLSVVTVVFIGKDFLPAFDEGATQVNFFLTPGAAMSATQQMNRVLDERFAPLTVSKERPDAPIEWMTCRVGRAEDDEHIMGVNTCECVLSLNRENDLTREELIELLHEKLDDLPGVSTEVEQPIAHLISHMLSGVTAQIAIKLFGDDIETLRAKAREIEAAISDIDGIAEPVVEPLTFVPQLRIELKREQLALHGVSAAQVHEMIETALNGRVVSSVLEGQRAFDLIVRFDEPYREDLTSLDRLPIETPDGRRLPLSELARVYRSMGPNEINRDDTRRRIVVRVNTLDRDLGSAVTMIQQRIRDRVDLPPGYFVVYGGQFEAQQSASRRLLLLSALAMVGVFVVLYATFPSTSLALQILTAIPIAFVGGVAAIVLTGQSLSVASMVGFISLGGIAARNGILLIGTYLNKLPEQGFTKEMIIDGSLDRLAPVLMTALTTGTALIPLVIGGHLPGREILYPVATVILGGLTTSTIAEFLIRPGLYWFFGERPSRAILSDRQDEQVRDSTVRQPAAFVELGSER